ncbi:Putative von Willebrand factor, vWF type A domain protein [Pseudomonas chlororaphis subsp. aureofaciens]|uniref:von Willebrand factor, vWF type A domain protein n=1 Tax=Pseudomonas chlororaphis subsp. aureofaciens TaxID=587851 RepID=A0AAD1E3Q9_9PSED|nr:VWA domain-containing protein [Pseudomonas chlororaphis]AZD83052.1 Putative von Willebrand factor, vWF type A domain protein [Pseudomonas chlororaphis subsp. aureofaciens]AZE27003.1 Putative von Willebrand factor, vWF type A domain protein [Pseudomonas chlororaphis subsp. aureofaciens]AZE33255.1 Putative von Willebrand factor, vWF type A domain protein [Pseudomonas chlororaphis subsp. aureofaciens]AZE39561.1 Putative von Willebrand factor, vWF type A domain protein [Pseudomonas chlororaphis 
MFLPPYYLRPAVQGCAAGLLLAMAGCGPSAPDTRGAALPVEDAVAPQAAAPSPSEAQRADVILAGSNNAKALAPTPLHTSMMTRESLPAGYRAEPREQYQNLPDNPIQSVAQAPVSTFSVDVDTGAYANVRRLLNQGSLPPQGAVRLEELVNYFPYDYALPGDGSPFGVTTEIAPSPWNPHTRLLRIGIKASDRTVAELAPANLVFLVDVSGSMDRREGLPLVQSTLKLLVDQLREQDRVSLVVYAGESRVVLEPTSGRDKAKIRNAIEQLTAGGSTAGASGIQLAYQMARQGFIKNGINRILLATDGDFNVGISDFDRLKQMAVEQRKSGVSLTTLGFGVDNYNEHLMEQLADAGDGNYAYIDNLREARKVLVDQLGSTLAVVAKDVKLQVEFNPAQVSEYRLLGYENRALKREDFNNDKVDAGEIGAGHTVTALYEIVPKGEQGWLEPLRYGQAQASSESNSKGDELAMLRVRYQAPQGGSSRLIERPILASQQHGKLAQASDDLRFAAAVAAFAQQLKDGRYTGDFGLKDTVALARGAKGEDRFGLRGEFVQLVELAQSLQTAAPVDQPGRSGEALSRRE